ncbi:hypothetical protein TNCV_660541 [Trichonephila clavipes]|nr:hypothetical protein TNCV_660541 [Trichonephila clavipes]
MNRCPDLVVCLKRDLQCLRPQASLVLTYRPNAVGVKGRVNLAQTFNRTQDMWCGSTRHYRSTLLVGSNSSDAQLADLNDPSFARYETNLGIGRTREGSRSA